MPVESFVQDAIVAEEEQAIADLSMNDDAEGGLATTDHAISLEYIDSLRDELGSQIEDMKTQLNKQGLNSNTVDEEIDSQKITPTETNEQQMLVIVLVAFGAILLILLLLVCFLCYKLSASKQ